MRGSQEEKEVRVLVATRNQEVYKFFDRCEDTQLLEAISTEGAYQALPQAHLAIVDLEELVESSLSRQALADLLQEAAIPLTTGDEFLGRPEVWLETGKGASARIPHLPPKTVAFVSYSGGVGRTTLALDTAIHFAEVTKLPTLLVEFCHGISAVAILSGIQAPHLYDCLTQGVKPARWRGVTLLPMDYDLAKLLPLEQIREYLEEEQASHILTVIDACYPHALLEAVRKEVLRWLVVASPRDYAILNGLQLKDELAPRASMVINRKRATDSMLLLGVEREVDLPNISDPDQFKGQLGGEMLSHIYRSWRRHDEKGFMATIGHLLGRGGGDRALRKGAV